MNTAPVNITKSCQVDDFIAKCKDKKSVTKKVYINNSKTPKRNKFVKNGKHDNLWKLKIMGVLLMFCPKFLFRW